jgi:hypothetical protein
MLDVLKNACKKILAGEAKIFVGLAAPYAMKIVLG